MASTVQRYAPYVVAVLALILAAAWLTPFDRALEASVAVIGLAIIGLAVGLARLRVTDWDAARAAERGLKVRDALTTALEFADESDEVHGLIQKRADEIVATASPRQAIPIHAEASNLRRLGLVVAVAVAFALLPPLGGAPALSADHATAIEKEAENVDKIADAVEQSEVEGSEELAEQLRQLAKELRQSSTLEEALQALDKTDASLRAKLDPTFLAQKAAAQGLVQDLTLRPLTPQGGPDPASQFSELARSLDGLSEQERQATAERLRELAASQASGNPTLSDQLSRAASALARGDNAGAREALGEASTGAQSGFEGVRGQQAISESSRALDGVRARLGQAQNPGQGQGQGQGEGQGQGQGQGQDQGQNQGQGQGQGQSGQGGQGGASGQIGGVAPGQGGASGQGGKGSVGGGNGQQHGTGVDSTIFDLVNRGSISDLLQVGIDGGSGDGDIVGRGDGPTERGESIIPYAQVLPRYLNDAADSLARLRLPPSMRGIVQNYFDGLAAEVR